MGWLLLSANVVGEFGYSRVVELAKKCQQQQILGLQDGIALKFAAPMAIGPLPG